MTEENEKRVRDIYTKMKTEQNRQITIKRLKEKQQKLERDNQVIQDYLHLIRDNLVIQGYLRLIKDIEELEKSTENGSPKLDNEIFFTAMNTLGPEDSTNNIYVYMGTYADVEDDMVPGTKGVKTQNDDEPNFGWKLYKNIELSTKDADRTVTKDELSSFEEESFILYPPEGMLPEVFYHQVRRVFFETLIQSGQEEAIKVIRSNYEHPVDTVPSIGSQKTSNYQKKKIQP